MFTQKIINYLVVVSRTSKPRFEVRIVFATLRTRLLVLVSVHSVTDYDCGNSGDETSQAEYNHKIKIHILSLSLTTQHYLRV